jgi:hypothetical protein
MDGLKEAQDLVEVCEELALQVRREIGKKIRKKGRYELVGGQAGW